MAGRAARWWTGLLMAAVAVAACGGTGPAAPSISFATGTEGPAASSTPGPASEAPASPAPASEAPATEAPATEAPATLPPSEGPSASAGQYLESITIRHTASCTGDNGSGSVGSIKISWIATGTTGVRISIDPPSPDVAYGYGYADYPDLAGSAVVPFACGPGLHDAKGSYHLYVVTTIHSKYEHYFYRYAKVYDVTP